MVNVTRGMDSFYWQMDPYVCQMSGKVQTWAIACVRVCVRVCVSVCVCQTVTSCSPEPKSASSAERERRAKPSLQNAHSLHTHGASRFRALNTTHTHTRAAHTYCVFPFLSNIHLCVLSVMKHRDVTQRCGHQDGVYTCSRENENWASA